MICPWCKRSAQQDDQRCRSCARRLDVAPDASDLLTVAAVVGGEFPLILLELASDYPRPVLLALLDHPVAAAAVEMAPGVARFRFRDAGARDDLYRALNPSLRAALHRRVGDALEQLHADDPVPPLATLAHHFCAAASDGDTTKAIDYSLRAGARAHATLDDEAAAKHFRDALDALDATTPASDEQRCAALLGLAEALGNAGARAEARLAAERALAVARRLASPDRIAHAVLAFAGRPQPFRLVDCNERVVALLEEALALLGEQDDPLRARVLGRLAEELTFSERHERMRAVADEAIAIARRQPDRAVLAYVLRATHWALWGPSNPSARVALAQEILAHSAAADERAPDLELDAHLFRLWALIELGDVPAARAELSGCARLADRIGHPYQRWLVATTRVCLAFAASELDSVPALAEVACALGAEGDNPNAILFYGIQTIYLQWLRGELHDAAQALRGIADTHPLLTLAVRAALADTYAEAGQLEAARRELDGVTARGLETLPRNLTWTTSMAFLAEASARVGDVERAARLYDHLAPLAASNLLLVPVASFGAAAAFLGLLATSLRRWSEADEHFAKASRLQAAMGTRHMLARTECDHAAMLLARGGEHDVPRALEKLARVRSLAEELGMRTLLERAASLAAAQSDGRAGPRHERAFAAVASRGAAASEPAAHPAGPIGPYAPAAHGTEPVATIAVAEVVALRREGEYVAVELKGKVARYRCSKGFARLGLLLGRPGTALPALVVAGLGEGSERAGEVPSAGELPSAGEGTDAHEAASAGSRDTGVLDRRALAEYRRHLGELRADLDEAERDNDLARAERLRAQIDALEQHVRASMTPAGQARAFTSDTDRARQAVQKSIAAAIARIGDDFADLGRHLATSVKTGATCSYEPGSPPPFAWDVAL